MNLVPLLAVMAIASLVQIAWPHPARGGAIITVNTTADEDLVNGTCSLREAIMAANMNMSYRGCSAGTGVNDTIVFNIGAGIHTINIGGLPLPPITEWVTIDGGAARVVLHGPGAPAAGGHHGLIVTPDGFGTTIRHLVINNFSDDGIFINADEVSVVGCFIGTDGTGMTAVPNQGFGVQVFGGNGVRIGGAKSGGPCTGDCNVISGATNFKANVFLDLNATGALVRGNFIGTNATGTAAITPNDVQGIIDKGGSDRIGGANGTTPGGSCTGDCNLVSGNNINGGVVIDQAATGSIVQGNFIGTDVTGNNAVSNGVDPGFSIGILSKAAGVLIGGTIPGARNVVSGNVGAGIVVRGLSTTVQGNYIGTNTAGTAAVPNSGNGVVVQANGAAIGGTAPGAGNLISGASGFGVEIVGANNAQIVGNLIGTAADGTTPLPNANPGISINAPSSNNTVGGLVPGAGNTIAFNGLDGVLVDGPQARGNAIQRNSIYSNEDAGISLLEDANDNLAAPTIEGINPLHGTSCAPCTVEIFSDLENEGRIFEGSVSTNDGNWTFAGPVSGPNVTATNTDMNNNTSEFSLPFSLPTPTPIPSQTPSRTLTATLTRTLTPTNTATTTFTRTATYTSTATPTATVTRTVTATATPTRTPSFTATASFTITPTRTGTSVPSGSPTRTGTLTLTPTSSVTATHTATSTATATPSATATATPTRTPSFTATASFTTTPTRTMTTTPTGSPTRTGTLTLIPTSSVTATTTATSTATPTASNTAPASATSTATASATNTATPTASATPSPTPIVPASPTSTAIPTPPLCVGDCDGNSKVSVEELVKGVNIALDNATLDQCQTFDCNGTGHVTVDCLVKGVNAALDGCSS